MTHSSDSSFTTAFKKYLAPLTDLALRLYMANIFFKSGWLKFQNYMNGDWDSTLFLFEEVHPVPFLPVDVAAVMGTAGELGLSILLALGLFSRFGALGLLVMTAVIQIVMPTPHVHIIWAIMLATILAHGGGTLSIDTFIKRLRFMR